MFLATVIIGMLVGKIYQKQQDLYGSNLLLTDVEALTEDETSGDWYLHYFPCEFLVTTDAQAAFSKVKIGSKVNISCMTQYFNHNSDNGFGPCEKGEQITCNEAITKLINQIN